MRLQLRSSGYKMWSVLRSAGSHQLGMMRPDATWRAARCSLSELSESCKARRPTTVCMMRVLGRWNEMGGGGLGEDGEGMGGEGVTRDGTVLASRSWDTGRVAIRGFGSKVCGGWGPRRFKLQTDVTSKKKVRGQKRKRRCLVLKVCNVIRVLSVVGHHPWPHLPPSLFQTEYL